jgi:hypothetical protein
MQKALVTVRYSLSGNAEKFRGDMDKAAAMIAAAPGLVWKIWGLDKERGVGLSTYLFNTAAQARSFASGPVIKGLKNRADVSDVFVEVAPIEHGLSALTGAGPALSSRPVAA